MTRKEVLDHDRDGRPVVVLAGSGRLADELAACGSDGDPDTRERTARGSIAVCELSDGAGALVAAVLAALAGSTGRTGG